MAHADVFYQNTVHLMGKYTYDIHWADAGGGVSRVRQSFLDDTLL
jgi:hypothetical protein